MEVLSIYNRQYLHLNTYQKAYRLLIDKITYDRGENSLTLEVLYKLEKQKWKHSTKICINLAGIFHLHGNKYLKVQVDNTATKEMLAKRAGWCCSNPK